LCHLLHLQHFVDRNDHRELDRELPDDRAAQLEVPAALDMGPRWRPEESFSADHLLIGGDPNVSGGLALRAHATSIRAGFVTAAPFPRRIDQAQARGDRQPSIESAYRITSSHWLGARHS